MTATDTSSVFGSEIGVLATLDEVMKLMFGYTPIAQLGDDFRPEPFRSYFDLRHRITKLRRKLAYRSFQLPSSDFQIKVREEMAMSVSERDGTPLLVWSQVVDELRQAACDPRDDEILRRLVVNSLEKAASPHLLFFVSHIDPTQPTLDMMLSILLSLHTQQFLPGSSPSKAISATPAARPALPAAPAATSAPVVAAAPAAGSPSAGASVSAIQAVQNNAPPRKTWQQRKGEKKSKKAASSSINSQPPPHKLIFKPGSPAPRGGQNNSNSDSHPSSSSYRGVQGRSAKPEQAVLQLYQALHDLEESKCADRVRQWLDRVNSQIEGDSKFQSPFRAVKDLWAVNQPQSRQLIRELRDIHRSCCKPASISAVSVAPDSASASAAATSSPALDHGGVSAPIFHIAALHAGSCLDEG